MCIIILNMQNSYIKSNNNKTKRKYLLFFCLKVFENRQQDDRQIKCVANKIRLKKCFRKKATENIKKTQ